MQESFDVPEISNFPSPKPLRRQDSLSLLLLTLFSIPALQPLLGGRVTCGFDNVFHLWRSVQMGYLLQSGTLFSRWAPHMAHGFGYPLYLFQSPFSAYLAALFEAAGFSWSAALNIVYGLGILASGWSIWLLARDLWGSRGALITAVAFVFAPYHAYVAYYRASLSETVAWAFVPLIFWGLLRWQGNHQQRRGLVTAVVAFILLVFTHDVTAYTFFPFIVGWVAALAIWQRSRNALLRGILALLLGMGGSAFFWLPAVAERPFVQFARANSGWPFLYFNNFLPLEQLLALPRNADPALINDWPERGLGLLLTGLAGAGFIFAWRHLPRQRWLTVYLGAMLAGSLFLTAGLSRPLWEAITILQAFQFPWRFLAPATFAASLLTGGCALAFGPIAAVNGRRLLDIAWPLGLVTLLSVAHWGWFYPQLCDAPDDTSLAGMVAWEEATGTLGTTASRELLPIYVTRMPQDAVELPIWEARLALADLPEEATLLHASYDPLRAEVELETAVPFTARFRAFYFPGWQVWVNGDLVEITPSDPEGLITFPVPVGQNTIQVEFGETPLRLAANILSLISLGMLALIVFRTKAKPAEVHLTLVSDQRRFLAAGFVLAASLLLVKGVLADGGFLPLRQTNLANGELTAVDHPSHLTFGTPANPALVRLLGHDEIPTAVAADEPLTIRLYWQALAQLNQDYRVGLTLVDENGVRWTEEGLRDYRWSLSAPQTQRWPMDKFAETAFFVDLLSGTPPGNYALQLSLFDADTFAPLTVYDGDVPLGPYLLLGQIEVSLPQRPFIPDAFLPKYPVELDTNELTLLGATIERTEARPGEQILLTLLGRNSTDNEQTAVISLLNEAGEVVTSQEMGFMPSANSYLRTQQFIFLPVSLADGSYTWQVQLPDGQTAPLGQLRIDSPERTFAQPPIDTAVAETFYKEEMPFATLVGYSLDRDTCQPTSGQCQISLIWQAEAESREAFRVFVQLLSRDGTVLTQHDAEPANWQRPTTGWLPGEYITDVHSLNLAAIDSLRDVHLIAGLYSLTDGRLLTDNGRDFLILAEDFP